MPILPIKELQKRILDISYRHKLSHIGSCLSVLPLMIAIYQKKKSTDNFVLSAGHSHLAHLVVMEKMGIIADAEKNLADFGIHCDTRAGCDASTGSLGLGIGIALGMALADPKRRVYCICTDGEAAEGSVYETLRIKQDKQVDNLRIYFNMNGWGALGPINVSVLSARLEAFGADAFYYPPKSDLPFLQDLQGHYHVLTQDEYTEALQKL